MGATLSFLCFQERCVNVRFGKLCSIPVGKPFQVVGLYLIGPLPTTYDGYRYILVVTDHFTKWAETFPLREISSAAIAQILTDKIVCRFGVMESLLTDQGSNLNSFLMQEIFSLLNIKKLNTTTPYHPQNDGMTERFNRTLISIMRHYVEDNQKDWDTLLPYATFAYNTSVQESTNENSLFSYAWS